MFALNGLMLTSTNQHTTEMKTPKESLNAFREIRSIIEDPGKDSDKLDKIHSIADDFVYEMTGGDRDQTHTKL